MLFMIKLIFDGLEGLVSKLPLKKKFSKFTFDQKLASVWVQVLVTCS